MGREARANKSAEFAKAHDFKKPVSPVRRQVAVTNSQEAVVQAILSSRGARFQRVASLLKAADNQKHR